MDLHLLKQSLQIRAGFIALQFACNLVVPDHVSDGFVAPAAANSSAAALDGVTSLLLSGLHRWDAQYILHVAQHGYTHEPTLAFLPGWPLLLHWAAAPLVSSRLLSPQQALLLSAVLLTTLLSALAAQALLALSLRVLRRPAQAHTAALLFCWSPATVFLTAPYSESLFACLSFTGMLLCRTRRLWGAAAAFGLAAVTRSNGTLLVGFLVYSLLEEQARMMFPPPVKENVPRATLPTVALWGCWRLLQAVLLCALALAAFAVYQLYAFVLYCTPGRLAVQQHVRLFVREAGHVAPGDMSSPWCNNTLPMSYGYIQDHYWDVGFLRYYQWRQIPNFLLAAPTVLLIMHGAAVYLRRLILQLRDRAVGGAGVNSALLPYVGHAAFLTCFMVTCAHVQVTTRLVASSSPLLYWLAAEHLHGDHSAEGPKAFGSGGSPLRWLSKPASRAGTYVQLYFLGYALLGTALFANNLPWT